MPSDENASEPASTQPSAPGSWRRGVISDSARGRGAGVEGRRARVRGAPPTRYSRRRAANRLPRRANWPELPPIRTSAAVAPACAACESGSKTFLIFSRPERAAKKFSPTIPCWKTPTSLPRWNTRPTQATIRRCASRDALPRRRTVPARAAAGASPPRRRRSNSPPSRSACARGRKRERPRLWRCRRCSPKPSGN